MSSNSKGQVSKLPAELLNQDLKERQEVFQIETEPSTEKAVITCQHSPIEVSAVEIKRVVKRMHGGSQARLIEGTDGHYYVAKFVGNPQGSRTLVNEWITWIILKQLNILTPRLQILRLPASLRSQELSFSVGKKKIPIQGTWHLGSRYPVDPLKTAVYDFFPRRLLSRVSNLRDFSRIIVTDMWLRQTDSRQAVFVRKPGLTNGQPHYLAHFIDHGAVLGGSRWQYSPSARRCAYYDETVYSIVDAHAICEETIAHIRSLSPANVYLAVSELPAEWFGDGDLNRLADVLDQLWQSRRRLRTDGILGRH